MNAATRRSGPHVSIGVLCRNDEDALAPALKSLFQQTIFRELHARSLTCEIVCVTSGCADNTPLIARWFCDEQRATHPCKSAFACRTVEIPEPEKVHAWNLFVHGLSTKSAQFCFLMDGNIVIDQSSTLWNMYEALTTHPEAVVAVDQTRTGSAQGLLRSLRQFPAFRPPSGPAEVRFSGQLYCIRAEVARNIYLPETLPIWEDEFIETIVCTDFLTHDPAKGSILLARNASHVSEPCHSLGELLRNQQRRVTGQAIVHVLVDTHLRHLSFVERVRLAETLQREERQDPSWLSRLIAAHVRKTKYFWDVFPGLLTGCGARLARLKWSERIFRFPGALARLTIDLASCWMAYHSLKHGTELWKPKT